MAEGDRHSVEVEHHHHHHHHRHRHSFFSWKRVQNKLSSFFHGLTVVPLMILLCAIGVMPILYDGGTAYWLPVELTLLTVGIATWLLAGWWCGREANRPYFHPILWLFGFVVFWGMIVQMMPFESLVNFVSPRACEVWKSFNELGLVNAKATISLAPDTTFGRAMHLLIGGLLFFMVCSLFRTKLTLKLIMLAIVVAALGNAIISFVDFFFSGKNGADSWSVFHGAFLNRNHFGFMMMMGILSAMGLMAGISGEGDRKSRAFGEVFGPKLLFPIATAGFLLMAALILSLSRGAFLGTVVGMLFFVGIWLFKTHGEYGKNKQIMIVLISMVALTLLLSMPYAMIALTERYEKLFENDLSLNARWLVWKSSFGVIKDYWLTGCGLGAFGGVVESYDVLHAGLLISHAHNDYLEFMAEVGLPLAMIVFGGLVWFWYFSLRRCLKNHDRVFRWLGISSLAAMLGCAVHEFFDYSLQAYSNTMLYVTLLAVIAVCASHHRRPENWSFMTSTERDQNRIDRMKWRLAFLPLALLLLVFLVPRLCKKVSSSYSANCLLEDFSSENASTSKTGKYEYLRRLTYIRKSHDVKGLKHRLLRGSAITKVGYALRFAASDNEKIDYIQQACQDISDSLRLDPLDGEVVLLAARIVKLANRFHLRDDAYEMVFGLYAWAQRCYPFIPQIVRESSLAAYEAYLWEEDEAKSAQYRDIAIKGMAGILIQSYENQLSIYEALATMLGSVEAVVAYVPDNISARTPLMEYFIRGGYYREALSLCNDLLAKASIPYDEYAKLEVIPLTPEEMMNRKLLLLDRRYMLYERLGMESELSRAWNEMETQLFICDTFDMTTQINVSKRIVRKNKKIAKRSKSSKNERTLHVLTPEGVIWQAQKAFDAHDVDETISKVMELSYFVGHTIDKTLLYKGLELIQNWRASVRPKSFFRARFLEAALRILLLEQGEKIDYAKYVIDLETLEEEQSSSVEKSWIQMHLVPYYLGRSQELEGEPSLAMEAYRRCLKLCPDNIWAIRCLERLSKGGETSLLTYHEQTLLNNINQRSCPIAYVAQSVQWVGLKVTPSLLTQMHEAATVEYYFICKGDVTQKCSWKMVYSDAKGNTFSDKISFGGAEELIWKVGQVITVRQPIKPFLALMNNQKSLLADGPVWVGASSTSIPHTQVKAFAVEIK
ncbi:MAG: O-antigen ligase family protein [Victivallales bacterium]|nr:O-antigen ligase family protein [Victivallales bacterium]